jgi:uncharacterized protein YjbI with pentapeptide repeats
MQIDKIEFNENKTNLKYTYEDKSEETFRIEEHPFIDLGCKIRYISLQNKFYLLVEDEKDFDNIIKDIRFRLTKNPDNTSKYTSEEAFYLNARFIFFIDIKFDNRTFSRDQNTGQKSLDSINKNKEIGSAEVNKRREEEEKIFAEELFKVINFQNSIFCKKAEFKDIKFNVDINFENSTFMKDINFENTVFEESVNFLGAKFKNNCTFKDSTFKKEIIFTTLENKELELNVLEFKNCIFEKSFILNTNNLHKNSPIMKIQKINFEESTFHKQVKIQFCEINIEANFYNTKFKELADFYQTKFNKVNFERTDFSDISVFARVHFKCPVDFKYTKFFGKAIFRDAVIEEKLNLRDTIFKDDANFLGMTSKKRANNQNNIEELNELTTDIKVANRETARIIKDSFDKLNNIIEANKYYKLEMKKRKEELNADKNENFVERLIFNIHGISSNHSQDALLALFWIMNIGFIASLFDHLINIDSCGNLINFSISYFIGSIGVILGIIGILNIVKDIFRKAASVFMVVSLWIFYGYTTKDFGLTDFANVINPFSIMTKGDPLNLGMLIFKVIIGYLMYQFVISIRQNTRRG